MLRFFKIHILSTNLDIGSFYSLCYRDNIIAGTQNTTSSSLATNGFNSSTKATASLEFVYFPVSGYDFFLAIFPSLLILFIVSCCCYTW